MAREKKSSKTTAKESKTPKADKKNPVVYLTKRRLKTIVGKAFEEASANAMTDMGYVIEVRDGLIVKETNDGVVTTISKISRTKKRNLLMRKLGN